MWESLEHSGWVQIISNSSFLYAATSVTHYFTLLFFIGAAALVDLRVLGVAGRNQTIARLAGQVLPWTWIGFVLASISGFLLFVTGAGDFAPDRIFQIKMLVIVLAAVCTFMVQRSFRKWNELGAMPASAKLVALASLLLWLGAILAAVDVSFISGIG